jgi:hypothetical protein
VPQFGGDSLGQSIEPLNLAMAPTDEGNVKNALHKVVHGAAGPVRSKGHRLLVSFNARYCALSLVILGASTTCDAASPVTPPSAAQIQSQHPLILVTFSNQPRGLPNPAGTTGRHYQGDGYLLTQSAQRMSQVVAATYSLRLIASWPIKALAVQCVIYEVPDGRSAADVLAALAKDSRVGNAQPLQMFHTLSHIIDGENARMADKAVHLTATP